jgi:hypothetical protein
MLKYFDYIFYRIYTFYKGKGDNYPLIQSLNFISISQMICIFTILQFLDKVSGGKLKVSAFDRNIFFTYWLALGIVIYILNLFRYKNSHQYIDLTDRYGTSHLNYTIRIWMIFTQPVLLIVITIVLLVLTKGSKFTL